MKLLRPIIYLSVLFIFLVSFVTTSLKTGEWKSLFNGKDLTGWDTYLGPEFDSLGKQETKIPVGLNKDPRKVFSIVNQSGENVIRISGEGFGAISSVEEFENYHLKLMFKWGMLSWPPNKNKKKDSGLLYHSVGPYGADYGFWMRSQEFQIEEGNCGDYWGVAGGIEDISAMKKSDSEYVFSPGGELYTFSSTSKQGRHCIKQKDAENTSGEWNSLELYCHGDTSVHVINGKVMMVLIHSRQAENKSESPLTKGKIQIQSEGAEIFYKQIMITPIQRIPGNLVY